MLSYDDIREEWGRTVIIPLAQAIRFYFEGEDAPRTPLAEVRFLESKNASIFDPVCIGAAIIIAIVFTILEPLVRKFIANTLSKFMTLPPSDLARLTESSWQLIYYLCIWLYCCVIVYDADWFYQTYLCWEPPFPNQEVGPLVWWMYIIQLGWYGHCLYSHLVHDVRKSDFWVMLIHHLAALILLYSAFATGYHRCGILCLYCLDLCDVFLHFTKVLRLIDNTKRVPMLIGVGSYVALVVCWLVFRVYLFLVKVLYTSSFQGLHYGGWKNSDNWLYYNALLILIFVLQLYWLYLILLAGYKFLRFGDALDDQRDPTHQSSKIKKQQQQLKKDK